MTARAAAGLLVSALVRRMDAIGGGAMVLARGDASAGAILILLAERGVPVGLVERIATADGAALRPTGPTDPAAIADYLARRRRSDPDLWIVELDAPDAAEIAAEVMG